MGQNRIQLKDSVMDVVMKMSENNPGAMTCIMEVLGYKNFYIVDGLMYILQCDDIGLYGTQLYMLWNDCCNRDPKLFELVIRNYQMGHLKAADILRATDPSVGHAKPFQNLKSLEEMFGDSQSNISRV